MEDPTLRASAAAPLLRACEPSRLERLFMSEAYEQLVPIVKCRCGELCGVPVDSWPVTPEHQGGDHRGTCGVGG
jgi:hypothetical protein